MVGLPWTEQRNTVSADFQSLLRNQKSLRFFWGFFKICVGCKHEHKLFDLLGCHVPGVC